MFAVFNFQTCLNMTPSITVTDVPYQFISIQTQLAVYVNAIAPVRASALQCGLPSGQTGPRAAALQGGTSGYT
jgi:hypothetical protein